MKRLTNALLVLLFVLLASSFLLVACGDSDDENGEDGIGSCSDATDVNTFWEEPNWADLSTADQSNWETLGWGQAAWDGEDDSAIPDSEEKCWSELSTEEQAAAEALCYNETNWNVTLPEGTCN